jgi:hypothetical protein
MDTQHIVMMILAVKPVVAPKVVEKYVGFKLL